MNFRIVLLVLTCIASLSAMGFSTRTERWSEDALLTDGRLITVEREVDYTFRVASGDAGSGYQLFKTWPDKFWLKFSHPDTKETIKWQGEQFFNPVLLDILNGTPYLVVLGRSTKDTESIYGCPELPYIYLQYDNSGLWGKWRPIPLEKAPDVLREANLSPEYPGVSKRHLSAAEVPQRVEIGERTMGGGYFQRAIPRTYGEWRYFAKNSYLNVRKPEDCRPARTPPPPVILPAASEQTLELLDTIEYTPERQVGSDDEARSLISFAREQACKEMFRPADPDDYMKGERFVHDSTGTKRVPYTRDQLGMEVRQMCDDHIWYITQPFSPQRDKVIIAKFTITGDLVYRISFRRPEPIQGFMSNFSFPSLRSEAGYLYFDWQDVRERHIKRILKMRVQEPTLSNIGARE